MECKFILQKLYIKFWFPVVVYSGIIFIVSGIPSLKTPGMANFDKLLHLCEYIPFGFLVARALFHTVDSISLDRVFWTCVIITFLYALSDEFHQSFVVGREASFVDVLADTLGGMISGYIYTKRKVKLKQ